MSSPRHLCRRDLQGLAKKYYDEKGFKTPVAYANDRNGLQKFISTPSSTLKAAHHLVRFHDISTTRDIIISVDRFYESFHKH